MPQGNAIFVRQLLHSCDVIMFCMPIVFTIRDLHFFQSFATVGAARDRRHGRRGRSFELSFCRHFAPHEGEQGQGSEVVSSRAGLVS